MCMFGMMRNPTVSIQGTMDPSSYSMPYLQTSRSTREMEGHEAYIWIVGNPSIPRRFTHSVSSEWLHCVTPRERTTYRKWNTDRHGFSDEFETRDRSSPQPIGSQQEPQITLSGRIVQKPLHYREVLVESLKGDLWHNSKHDNCGSVPMCPME